jgi:Protein of unknown function (DUF3987)
MTDLSVPEIVAGLNARIEGLCRELLANGQRIGNEWQVGSVNGEPGKSLKIHIGASKPGAWSDFATGESGDALDLVQSVHGCDKGTAVIWAKDWLGINGSVARGPIAAKPGLDDGWKIITPIPLDAGKAPAHPEYGALSQRWFYRDSNGAIAAIIYRFERPEGKTIRPMTYWRRPDGSCGWEWRQHPEPRPLYGLDRLKKSSSIPVLVCEGEKVADAAANLFHDLCGITWMGGANAVSKADWTPLEGRTVLVWPDNDGAGRSAAEAVAQACIDVGVHEVRIVEIPSNWPEKWDLADPLPVGVTHDDLDRLRKEAKPPTLLDDRKARVAVIDNGWPEPDLSILNDSRRPPPPFLYDPFGDFWSDFIARNAELKGAPPDYVAASVLAGAACLIGNARWVSPWDGWTEPPVLRIGNIGIPSAGKSPSQEPVFNMLDTLEQEMLPAFEEKLNAHEGQIEVAKHAVEVWRDECKDAADQNVPPPPKPQAAIEPEEPVQPRLCVGDITYEKLLTMLAQLPKGLMVRRDELAGWHRGMDRYTGGASGERQFWCEAFGGRRFTVDRVKYGSEAAVIDRASVSIVGNTVPESVPEMLRGKADDGLVSRFLWVWPDPVPPTRPSGSYDQSRALNAFRRLRDLQMGTDDSHTPCPVVMPLTNEAADLFQNWRLTHYQEELRAHGLYGTHLGKLNGVAVRLALIFELLWWSTAEPSPPPEKVGAESISRALELIDGYFKPMSARVFNDAAISDAERDAAAIAHGIMERHPAILNVTEICREWRLPGLRAPKSVKAALTVLEQAGWVKHAPARVGNSGGRLRDDYAINPKLNGKSA